MTTVPKFRGWSKTERHLYGGQAVRATGTVDKAGRLEMEFLSGPLNTLRRWFTMDELISNATPDPLRATESDENGVSGIRNHVTGQNDRTGDSGASGDKQP